LSALPSLQALAFFRGAEGQRLLELAASLVGDEWRAQAVLREHYPPWLCREALSLAGLRLAGRGKFAMADRMYFDREGLEMASGQEVAEYRAGRLRPATDVLDLCCGIGGDLLPLSRTSRVRAVDWDRPRLEMARMNSVVAGVSDASFALADVRSLRLRAQAGFLDPSRRSGGQRIRHAEGYSPPLSWIEEARRALPDLAVKVSPGIREEELPGGCEVEFISSRGECREAVLYYGSLARARRRATVLPGPHCLEAGEGPAVPVGPLGAVLYDPDPAVVRSHLLDELARLLDAWKLDPRIAYLAGSAVRHSPFAQAFQVVTTLPFHLRRVREYLRAAGLSPVEIKRRRFPIEPEELRRLLDMEPGGNSAVLVLTRLQDRPVAMVCTRLSATRAAAP
jgi:SAM-dependent methyltransferase